MRPKREIFWREKNSFFLWFVITSPHADFFTLVIVISGSFVIRYEEMCVHFILSSSLRLELIFYVQVFRLIKEFVAVLGLPGGILCIENKPLRGESTDYIFYKFLTNIYFLLHI